MPSSFFKSDGHPRVLPSFPTRRSPDLPKASSLSGIYPSLGRRVPTLIPPVNGIRSEEHTSELQSQSNIGCRLLFLNQTGTPEFYPLSLHDALPIYRKRQACRASIRALAVGSQP